MGGEAAHPGVAPCRDSAYNTRNTRNARNEALLRFLTPAMNTRKLVMNTRKLVAFLLFLFMVTPAGAACKIVWDYEDSSWLTGFDFYQNGSKVGSVEPTVREAFCEAAGLTPGPGPVTMTAVRDADSSPHSDPAVFILIAPGLQIVISTP